MREWLLDLNRDDRKVIGYGTKTTQYGWPIVTPLIRKLEPSLREVRSMIDRRIARVIFTIEENVMVSLHSFAKKSAKTPSNDLQVARDRLSTLRGAK